MKKYLTASIVTALLSCQGNDPETNGTDNADTTNATTVSPKEPAEKDPAESDDRDGRNNKNCYASYQNKDVVLLSFMQMDSLITGDLAYSYYEKDRNKGKIKGVMRGDTIIAEYNFESEGVLSVREVIFLKKGDTIIEGFGDVVDDHGKMIYKDHASLTFDNSLALKKVNCEKQEQAQSK
jgi:hypothetical protein